jgi:hypothetical protein
MKRIGRCEYKERNQTILFYSNALDVRSYARVRLSLYPHEYVKDEQMWLDPSWMNE